jgi:hypothetical protein
MDPLLVCKIVVRRDDGMEVRGTGYPIADDRIITAAHVVSGRVDDEDAIKLLFPEGDEPLQTAVPIRVLWSEVIWNGDDADPPVDVVILRCELPEHLRPRLTLLRHRPIDPVAWHAKGYSALAQERMESGLQNYNGGHFPLLTGNESSVLLDCTSGPKRKKGDDEAKLWGGVSGSGIFEKGGRRRLLAVTTHYVSEEYLPTLKVVPLLYLFTLAGFEAAVFSEHTRQKRLEVVEHVRAKLIEELDKLSKGEEDNSWLITTLNSVPDCKVTEDATTEKIAEAILNCREIPTLIASISDLSDSMKHLAKGFSEIASWILPLNYATETVNALHEVTNSAQRFWFVESSVRTSTLAEVIMAGFDCSAVDFPPRHVSGKKHQITSPVAIDLSTDPSPVVGPESHFEVVNQDIRDLQNRMGTGGSVDNLTTTEIHELRSALVRRNRKLGKRTTYCIVKAPEVSHNSSRLEDGGSRKDVVRQGWIRKLKGISELLNPPQGAPLVVFVERVTDAGKPGITDTPEEISIQTEFRALLLNAYDEAPLKA